MDIDKTKRHFFKHGGQDPRVLPDSEEVRNCHWCQLRSFESHAKYPISIVNDTDDGAVLPAGFRFISQNVLRPGVERAEDSFRSGCDCEDERECMYGGCQCLADLYDSDDEEGSSSGGEDDDYGTNNSGRGSGPMKFAYYASGPRAGLLRSSFLTSRRPIYECHEGCRCGADCPNRVVERGRTVPLQIFRTDDGRGWGVRSPIAIKRGQFVDTYVGEVITSGEADARRAAAGATSAREAKHKDVYLFALDKFSDEDSLDERLRGPPLEVDGEYRSGPSRFINHSCDPSMRIFARVGDHADRHIHDLALFAIRDIPKGEELTFDYVDGGLENSNFDVARNKHAMTRCLCKSAKCRGFLW